MAGVMKQYLPGCCIIFLGRDYTRPVIESSRFVDEFISWDAVKNLPLPEQIETFKRLHADVIIHVFQVWEITKLAKRAGIPLRIGTTHRLFTWFYCNRLVCFSRKKSDLHEAQLNMKLLKPLGTKVMLSRKELPEYYGMEETSEKQTSNIQNLKSTTDNRQSPFKLILHPKSKGSAREWGLDNFSRLIDLLPEERYTIFITGTEAERATMKEFLERNKERVNDMTGKLTLPEFLDFIRECDGLIAASTGPLHLAAAFGKVAVGLYAPMRPIYPTRWAPLGKKASYLVVNKKCNDCRKSFDCHCMKEINAEDIVNILDSE